VALQDHCTVVIKRKKQAAISNKNKTVKQIEQHRIADIILSVG